MERVSLFIDGANMFYAQRDNGWHINFKKVYEYFGKDKQITVACYFTGTPHYEETEQIGDYRGFKNFLINTGYRVVEKEVKRIKHKIPKDVLINGKKLKNIIKEEIQKEGKTPEEIKLGNVDVKLYKGEEEKADLDVDITLTMTAEKEHYDQVIFFGGDGDFKSLLSFLRNNGKYIICVGRKESTALELKNIAHKFIDLNQIRGEIEKGGS